MKYFSIALLTILCGMLTSCEDFLKEDPKGLVTPDNFFKNEAEANLALNGLQATMPNVVSIGTHLGTDIGVTGRFAIAAGWLSAVYVFDVDNVNVANQWAGAYSSIRNANLILSRIEASPLSEQVKGRTIAQALFYRAMYYFDLTTTYGDVPYWRDEVDIEKVSLLGKTQASVIQNEMIADLEKAISSGYLSTARWNQNGGRPTVWSVRMLKAYYHVWQKQWDEARKELVEITTKSPHGPNLGPYGDMYREGNEFNNELIFGREFLSGVQNNLAFQTAHFNSNAENVNTRTAMAQTNVFAASAALTLRKSFANTYAANDARKPYNVWDSHTLANGTKAVFNWIYIPKLMRAALPLSDPLMKTPDPQGLSGEPSRIFRISDAYLLLAEAEFLINGTSPAALAAINKVRQRANLPNLTVLTLKDIQNERGWELAGEGFLGRKGDLIRWGILESTILALPAVEKAAGAYSLALTRAQDEANIIAAAPVGKYRVYPVPLSEILKSKDLGGALVQNPLWEGPK